LSATDGARAVLIAVAVNTAAKAMMVAGLGDRRQLRAVIAVLGLAAAAGVLAWSML
jgi:hypothetical protein